MNNEPPVIISSAAPLPPPRRSTNLSLILIVLLGLGTVGFGLASISAFSQASTAKSTLNSAKNAAASAARTAQKQQDDLDAIHAAESPFRSFTAPIEFGAFVINFPKNWSLTADLESNANTQVQLDMHPVIIRTINGNLDLQAIQVMLIRQQLSNYLARFNPKKVTQSTVTVSGIQATQLTGTLPDGRANKIVAVPVRDKTLVFDNEDPAYAAEFATILAQAKINP